MTPAEEIALWRRIGYEPDWEDWVRRRLMARTQPPTPEEIAIVAWALKDEFGAGPIDSRS